MEITDIFGPLKGFSVDTIIDKFFFFLGIGVLLAIIGGVFFAFWYFKKKEKTATGKKTIIWWAEGAGGKLEQRDIQTVEELLIPGTKLRIFYDKKKDQYLPRFTREVKRDSYYALRTPSGNIVNFGMKGLDKTFKEADMEFDHTDMLWASENAREFIKRNYRDKSQKWWQVYQGAITTAIYILILTFSFVIIIFFLRGVVEDIGTVANAAAAAAEMCQTPPTSGLAGAA